jgi:glycosyltransferase involved in cell wall biosynthesis
VHVNQMDASVMTAVGIVIPAHNAARFLPQTIESIRQQTFQDWKCVIVDDASSDHTREIGACGCEADVRFSLLSLPQNGGSSAARNAGLAALQESVRYVIFLDSDDVWNAGSLKILVDAMEAHPSWSAVYGNCRVIDCDGKYVPNDAVEIAGRERFDFLDGRLARVIGSEDATFCQLLLRNPVVSPGCLLIRAEVIAEVTGGTSALFDAGTQYGEDLGAWLRIRRAGCIGYIDQTVLDYRLHTCNKSNQRWGMAMSVRKVRLRAVLDPTMDDDAFHHACAASRAYRSFRLRGELKSAVSCLWHRQFRAGRQWCGFAVASSIDVLISAVLQARRSAWNVERGRAQGARIPRDVDAPAFDTSGGHAGVAATANVSLDNADEQEHLAMDA